jgi:two-component system, NtrC family, sensor histidine kinase GlrK
MRIGRPQTLLGLILTGLGLVTLPLLVAIANGVIKLGQLATESELVVSNSAAVTLEAQRLAGYLGDMERNARQYEVLQNPDLLTLYEEEQAGLDESLAALAALPHDAGIAGQIGHIKDIARGLHDTLRASPTDETQQRLIEGFRAMETDAREIAQAMRLQTNQELGALQQSTRDAQRTLAWEAAALVPGTLALIVFFLILVGRPMRQVDRAIRELGKGDFSHPISVTGPRDIEMLGRQLEWLRNRFAESTEEKNRFLRHMSHELKTPLANIREGTELLMDGSVGDLDIQQQEVTTILRDNGVKLQKLIENLLTFSAWQTKTASLDIAEFEVKPLVFSVLSQHRLVISNRKIKLQLKVSPVTVRADEGKLRLVLENLISNAIKFTPNGGFIHLGASLEGPELLIDVADSGPGVDAEDEDRIFEAFYQGRRLQGGPVGGTGIGLSVVSECVQAHQGSVRLVKGEWPGAHFQVRLPIQAAPEKTLTLVAHG